MKKIALSKKKMCFIIGIILCSLLGFMGIRYYQEHRLQLQQEVWIYEYGTPVDMKVENYIKKGSHDDIIKNAKLDTMITNEKGKKYPAVGTYPSHITYKNQKKEFSIQVKDSVKPVWKINPTLIRIEENAENVKLEDYFKAEDISGVKIKIVSTDFNIKKAGKYTATVAAEDKYNNSISQKVNIIVSSLKDIQTNKLTKTVKGTIPESPQRREEREIKKAKKTSQSAGNRPKPITGHVNKPATSVSSGRRITLNRLAAFNPPAEIPQGPLTPREYSILSSFYHYIVERDERNFTVHVTHYTEEECHRAMKHLNNVLGVEVPYRLKYETNKETGEKELKLLVLLRDFTQEHKSQERRELAYDACVKAGLKNGMTEKEAVKRINNWIIDHMTYKINNGNADVGFKTGKGQCHTYAQMFDEMCAVVNIPCTYESGYADGAGGWGRHAWNKVKIGNSWYYIDTTWNDSPPRNRYYLSKTLWSNHKVG